jgi:hypothetical protein
MPIFFTSPAVYIIRSESAAHIVTGAVSSSAKRAGRSAGVIEMVS